MPAAALLHYLLLHCLLLSPATSFLFLSTEFSLWSSGWLACKLLVVGRAGP